jgi:DNA-binding GntR family transcriptional regulator
MNSRHAAIAGELGVSQTPVRDALSRLSAEGACRDPLEAARARAEMTSERFDDLLRCRYCLSRKRRAGLPHLNGADVQRAS